MSYVILIIWAFNLAISFYNARGVGLVWADAKAQGGWPRAMAWMGAIMAGSGFSWCLLIFLALGANAAFPARFSDHALSASLSLGYVLILPGVLVSGMAITIDSWITAHRTGRWGDRARAAYNTLAQVSNTASAVKDFGGAARESGGLFKGGAGAGGDVKGIGALIVILMVAVSLLGGVLITVAIIQHYARVAKSLCAISHRPAGSLQ
jgi:hypothetical protein